MPSIARRLDDWVRWFADASPLMLVPTATREDQAASVGSESERAESERVGRRLPLPRPGGRSRTRSGR